MRYWLLKIIELFDTINAEPETEPETTPEPAPLTASTRRTKKNGGTKS